MKRKGKLRLGGHLFFFKTMYLELDLKGNIFICAFVFGAGPRLNVEWKFPHLVHLETGDS